METAQGVCCLPVRSAPSLLLALVASATIVASAAARPPPRDGPSDERVAFGRARLEAAAHGASDAVEVAIEGNGAPESFAITPSTGGAAHGHAARVVASDPTGAMYGLLELA